MKRWMFAIILLNVFIGCGPSEKKDSSKQLVDLAEQVQILQQSIEIQAKEIKGLRLEMASLKLQLAAVDSNFTEIEDLNARVSRLETDTTGFEK